MNNEQLADELIEIGTIVAPQGIKGEVRVLVNSDFPERFEQPGMRWLQRPDSSVPQLIELLQGRKIPGKNVYVVQLAGVEDRNTAEDLRGCKLLVNKRDRPQLAQDEYHVSDLINLEVYNQLDGKNIGFVIDVFTAGNDLLEVQLHEQSPQKYPQKQTDLANISRRSKRRKFRFKKTKPATILIPFVKDIVTMVDLEKGCLEILPPPGLLEINNS
ncbi:MAG: ribosome maturation factor RimM [Oscillatoria sp. PMC 1051.18]|nr:ribosome maturation factor RimM [Oscillatoria sp. PMC 1050.18]MEC5030425.1 ribosome maturation factor RimM [Oscillatoria sp. PMC 1051.18]